MRNRFAVSSVTGLKMYLRSNKDIERVLQELDDSEVSDLSDAEDTAWEPDEYLHTGAENDVVEPETVAETSPESEPSSTECGTAKELRFKWRKKHFSRRDARFTGPVITTNEEVKSPVGYFTKYFTKDIFELISAQTNLYSVQKSGTSVKCTCSEIRKLFGAHIIMGTLSFPRLRMYWEPHTRIPLIADHFSVNMVFRLRNNLHLVDNEQGNSGDDKLWKVRPLLDRIRQTCLSLKQEERQSIDEQMIPFKGRTIMKQFVRGKPNPVGLKNFVRCGVSGLVYDFEIYQGKSTGIGDQHKHLGLGGSVVMRLCENVPQGCGYKAYFDNFFTSLPLIRELLGRKIYAVGTIRANRLHKCPLKSEAELKKEGRGAVDEAVPVEEDFCVVRWLDNGVVTLASSYVGTDYVDKVRRWSASQKQHVEIARPEIVKEYCAFMGGVDKMDFLISLYRIKLKTRKWTLKVIFHMVDLAVCNSWLQYQRDMDLTHRSKKERMDLLTFRNTIAEALILMEETNSSSTTRKRGRPRSIPSEEEDGDEDEPQSHPEKKAKKANQETRPVSDVRYDGFAHWPNYIEGREQRCKLEGCKGRSRIQCSKCQVTLCVNKHNNCFVTFHQK